MRAAIVVATILAAAIWVLRPLPISQLDGRALEFVDRSGLELGTILSRDGEHTAYVPLDRIAPPFVRALLAMEDNRFFEHGSLDVQGTARAMLGAIQRRREPGGASTISMQLGRMLRPVSNGFAGRIAEVVLALRLENATSKRAILEAYCNRVPMGANLYGVEAAALAYFGVHASDLDLAQASLLAAIPNAPSRLEPYRHWAALKARQRLALARMVATGATTLDEARAAAAETLALQPRGAGIVAAAHALFWLAPQAPADASVVQTTLDRPLQRFVEEQLRSVVATLGSHAVRDAAALVLDNRSGEILAYAGSPDYFDDLALGRNDGVQALRQPGSALKPFLYELALERRVLRPNTILLDAPVSYAIPGGRLYQPSDYDRRFLGPVRVRLALANSLNVPAVRVLERIGVPAFLARLRSLGFEHLRFPPDYYGLGLTLGGGEVSLFELTRAYATLARGGAPVRVHALVGLADPASTPSEVAASVRSPAASSTASAASDASASSTLDAPRDAAWALVTDILADRHARATAFGVDSVLALPFDAAVKTGTSSDFRDTWTVGFTRDYTVGVWVGNFDGSPMREISGVTGAGPLWNRIMLHLHEPKEPLGFAKPVGYRRTTICSNTGLRPSRDCPALVQEWLDPSDRARLARVPLPRSAPSLAIAFPHDGDRFALIPGGGTQRIDLVLNEDPSRVNVKVDGRILPRHAGVYSWNLRLGAHTFIVTTGRASARARISVERPARPAREGFSDVSG